MYGTNYSEKKPTRNLLRIAAGNKQAGNFENEEYKSKSGSNAGKESETFISLTCIFMFEYTGHEDVITKRVTIWITRISKSIISRA